MEAASSIDGHIKDLFDEANTNHTSGRFVDAGKGFEYLIDKCVELKKYEDMYYFIYRALLSWGRSGDDFKVARLLQRIGIDSLKISTLHSINTANSSASQTKMVQMLYLAQANLKCLGENSNRKNILEALCEAYRDLVKDVTITRNEKKDFLDKLIEVTKEINNTDHLQEARKLLGEVLIDEANELSKRGGLSNNSIYSHTLILAALQYQEVEDFQMVIELVDKAKQGDPSLDLSRYDQLDIPTVNNLS